MSKQSFPIAPWSLVLSLYFLPTQYTFADEDTTDVISASSDDVEGESDGSTAEVDQDDRSRDVSWEEAIPH